MRDFFTFYRDIKQMDLPFLAFSWMHIVFLLIAFSLIFLLYHLYQTWSSERQHKFLIGMGCYFLIEELIYISWLLLTCHERVWEQVLPLELCSICAYMNALSAFTKKLEFRYFSGVVGLIAGLVAMLYPANISGLYPTVSYRTINFYMLHGSFILFAILQLRDVKLLQFRYMKKNYLIICCLYTFAFFVNMLLHTQYMFVGMPPNISFIASLYHLTGNFLFLPTILCILFLIHVLVVYLLRKIYRVRAMEEQHISYRW